MKVVMKVAKCTFMVIGIGVTVLVGAILTAAAISTDFDQEM